jgi:hypothetical protein
MFIDFASTKGLVIDMLFTTVLLLKGGTMKESVNLELLVFPPHVRRGSDTKSC